MKKWLLAAAALAVLLAGWHPVPKEPEGLALVRVLGVDGSGPVTLTAVCGGADQEGDQSRGRCTGADFEKSLEKMPWSGEEELSLTSVTYFIAGRDVDLENVLLTALRDEKLGANVTVWLGPDGAAALLGGCEDPASELELLERQGVRGPTVVEALAALYEGEGLRLPTLTANKDGLTLSGWAEWRSAHEQ